MNQHTPEEIEAFLTSLPWGTGINFNVYHDAFHHQCHCGSVNFKKHGHVFTNAGKFTRYICKSCGAESVDKANLLIKEKKQSLRK